MPIAVANYDDKLCQHDNSRLIMKERAYSFFFKNVQASRVLQHRFLEISRDGVHAIATHVQRHLARHHRLLPHELILLLLAYTHKALLSKSVRCQNKTDFQAIPWTNLIVREVLADIVAVSSFALSLEKLPEETPPVQ